MWVNSTGANRIRDGKPAEEHGHSASITTMFPDSGRTSHHKARHVQWITGWDLLEFITLWKNVECTGRRLQQIPAGLPRDHVPILLTLRYILQPQRGEAPTARRGLDGTCKRLQIACRR